MNINNFIDEVFVVLRKHSGEQLSESNILAIMQETKDALIAKDSTQIPAEEFYQQLTRLEIDAYRAIINTVKTDGDIIISKLCETTNISRPVFNTLMVKLQQLNVALVTNRGVKGTHITIINPYLCEEINGMR